MKKHLAALATLLFAVAAFAQPSATYYQSVNGLAKEELKKALRLIISSHNKTPYNSLDNEYPKIYYLYDDEKGLSTARVYDIFSDEVFAFTSTTMWNKEHVVPKSWWGNSTSIPAYSDLFSVIPSLATANSAKSNYPPGIVDKTSSKAKNSGRIWTGPATDGTGGTYSNVWEPYDDFKGDFARIVMYVATCYADIDWGSNANVSSEIVKEEWPTLSPWLYRLMLRWHNADPVSEKEKRINNDVFDVQGNRNPFIDYPALADYIWGDYTTKPFDLSAATLYAHVGGGTTSFTVTYMANGGSAAPAAQTTQDSRVTLTTALPYRHGYVFTGWNTRADGRGQSYSPGQTYILSANVTLYAQWAESGDHSDTLWQLVTSADQLAAGDSYIIAYNTASFVAGELNTSFLTTVAAAFSDDKTTLDELPAGALTFVLGGTSGKWTLTSTAGALGATAAKKLAFGSGTTTWDITFASNGTATIASTNASYGTLQYNASSPRFTTYTSNQKPVQLYRQVQTSRRHMVTTTDFCYATLYLDYPVSIPDGATAYYATLSDDADAVLLHPIADAIPAHTAVVVQAEASTTYTFTETTLTTPTDMNGNLLIGFSTDTPVTGTPDVSYYALNRRQAESHQASLDGQGAKEEDEVNRRDADDLVGFFAPKGAGNPHGSFTAIAHKAYLRLAGITAAPSLALRIDDATALHPLEDDSENASTPDLDAPIYNLAGQRVYHLTRGIYIANGHKIIVKE